MTTSIVGTVIGLAIRTAVGGPMQELERLEVSPDGGVEGDVTAPVDRAITLMSSHQWEEVVEELGTDYPWHTRRANVLVDCERLGHLMGQTLELGAVVIEVKGETDPCAVMERIDPRLKQALVPDWRGGIYGRVVQGGTISLGDTLELRPAAD
ncbi:MAG: MOSC domain-containing protein [Planctomycetaceae bacterium]|nr:MOSC domain-containing protein [Planctomycetaceae bacterium]